MGEGERVRGEGENEKWEKINKELETKLPVGLGFNLGFVSKFSFFLFPALVPRTPGGDGQVNRKCFLSYWRFLY